MYFEQTSDVDLGRPTVVHDPDENSLTVTWAGHGLAVVLNPAEAHELVGAITEALGEDE